MSPSSFVWKGDEFLARMRVVIDDALKIGAETAADLAGRSMGFNHGGVRSAPGRPPNSQGGTLRNSLRYVRPANWKPNTAAFGTNIRYSRILEQGGTIFSKGKLLTIPLNREAAFLRGRTANLRTAKLRFVRTATGAGLLVKDTGGRKARATPMFVLKRSVRISPRPYLMPAARSPLVQARMRAAFKVGLAKVGAQMKGGK